MYESIISTIFSLLSVILSDISTTITMNFFSKIQLINNMKRFVGKLKFRIAVIKIYRGNFRVFEPN